MKSKFYYPFVFFLGSASLVMGQVGINTSAPQSTLDVVGNGASTTTKDGVMTPRITRQQLAAKAAGTYAASQSSAIVYVTDATTPTGTIPSVAQTVEITVPGYYFFNGTLWKNVNDGALNLYNSDGTLTGIRTVTQGANPLTFTSTVVNGFSIDGTTFSVDAANNRVGIGSAAPQTNAHILNSGTGGTAVTTANTANMALRLENSGNGQAVIQHLLAKDASGTAKQTVMGINPTTIGGNGIFLLTRTGGNDLVMDLVNGNFGMGDLPTATEKLFVSGNTDVRSGGTGGAAVTTSNTANMALRLENSGNGQAVIQHILAKDASGTNKEAIMGINPTTGGGNGIFILSRTGSNDLVMDLVNGNFGMGTTPIATAKLSVNGNTGVTSNGTGGTTVTTSNTANMALRLENSGNGQAVIQHLLAKDASGTTKEAIMGINPTVNTNGIFLLSRTGSNDLVMDLVNGNFGMGTTPTATAKLNVAGNIVASGTITPSDIRIKKDIVDNTYGLKEILNLRTINYKYKDEKLSKDKKIGFIAQEVKAAMPELVNVDDDEMKTLGVNYAEMTVVLTKAVQQQQETLKKQEEMLKRQQEQINSLKTQIKKLKPNS
ncbi:hypothetical protein HHL23_00050 [Chryseobacterium sp. RP-3-3]|uniref:Peptidase S74 domain-containing protein n=1 Tax=Chryseobacterium antibioticum TaxID=2728847 RepID=A0A7Y0FQ16_9FLAO|nr:tail fiber domain-containing protein [Chryseobacterium antibioticum]NML68205.1 hypothetical protein [Chryseobacterium antibioticum]